MRIDRPDEDDSSAAGHDAPTVERESPVFVEHDGWADSAADRTAFSLKYRANVEAAYQAAWGEAVPAFARAWEELQEKDPDPERSRPTVRDDGSWRGDGDRELNPARTAEVDRGSELIREVGENKIIPRFGSRSSTRMSHI